MADRSPTTDVRDLARLLRGHLRKYRTGRLQDLATANVRQDLEHPGWVIPAINATLRARMALTRAVYLEPRRIASRLRFTLSGQVAPAPRLRLSLLCPTRSRPDWLATLLRSLDRTVFDGSRVEILCYVDSDDPLLPRYRILFDRVHRRYRRLNRFVLHVGEPIGVPKTWNVLADAATGDFLLMANDDQEYVDYAWDLKLDRSAAELVCRHPDGVLCCYFDGGQYPEGGQDFPIVSRPWFETLGYFGPTIFQQWSAEKWIFDIADRIGRLYPIPGVFVEHLHYQDFKAPFDATYQRHRMTRETSFADQALFLRTARDREREAGKLRDAIAMGGRDPIAADHLELAARMKESAAMTTTDRTAQTAQDVGTKAYITQMARRHYSNLIDAWYFDGRREQARECAELAVRQGVWDNPLQRPREHIPGLRTQPVFDPSQFWFAGFLEEQYPQIRTEIETVLDTAAGQAHSVADGAALLRTGAWEQAPLFKDGHWQEPMCSLFPVTTTLLREIPEVTTFNPGTVMISRLKPGTHIMPHCGPTNAVLRIHLGITIPPGTHFRVEEQELSWQEGKCLIFDESFEHEVRHEGTEDRIVLILDMLHPALGQDHRERLLHRRLTFEEQIVTFMRERGLDRIGLRDGELVFHPDDATRDVATLYMAATGIVGAELRDDKAVWRRKVDQPVDHA